MALMAPIAKMVELAVMVIMAVMANGHDNLDLSERPDLKGEFNSGLIK